MKIYKDEDKRPWFIYDEPLAEDKRIIRRLRSTKRSGKYYFITPLPLSEKREECRWGINDAPYKPLFKVETNRYYYLKMVRGLERGINTDLRWGYLYPRGRFACEIDEFVESMQNPIMVAIGRGAIRPKDVWDIEALRKFKEVFIFDKSKTRDLFGERKEKHQRILADCEWSDWQQVQGGLQCKEGRPRTGTLAVNQFTEINWRAMSTVLFNHHIEADRDVYSLSLNNERLLYSETPNVFLLDSYDHDSVRIEVEEGTVLRFRHPFPSDSGSD